MNQIINYLLTRSRPFKRLIVLVSDSVICIASVWLAMYLRLGEPIHDGVRFTQLAAASILLALPLFIRFGLYRAIFRYSGLPALMAVASATFFYGVGFFAVFTVWGVDGIPRTVGIIQPILLFLMVGATRALARIWLGGLYELRRKRSALPQALIYGAGSAGRQLASAVQNSHDIQVVGFLDDDPHLHGQLLNGLRIHDPAKLDTLLTQIDEIGRAHV